MASSDNTLDDITCPQCSSRLHAKTESETGRLYLGCARKPPCTGRRDVRHSDRSSCPKCSGSWALRQNRASGNWFLGCSNYPRCKTSRPLWLVPLSQSSGHGPTEEQSAIINNFIVGSDMLVRALAGTGKTSTLRMLTEEYEDLRFQYVVFNKSMEREAQTRFGANVDISTAHALAFHGMNMGPERARISVRPTNEDLVTALGTTTFSGTCNGDAVEFSPAQVAEFARATVATFVKTTSDVISAEHVTFKSGQLPSATRVPAALRDEIGAHVLPYAVALWNSYCSHKGLGYANSHDIYLKRWQLTEPVIDADVILFDEAQDADPVMTAIIAAQEDTHVVYCGDENQAIYEWRGAENALEAFATERGDTVDDYWLTQSFRFGPAVAQEAERFLQLLGCPEQIRGFEDVHSIVGPIDSPRCTLCRTNRGMLTAISEAVDANRRPHVLGDSYVPRMLSLAQACAQLQAGMPFDHSAINAFSNWGEAVAWASHEDQELDQDASLIMTINDMGAKRVLFLLNRHVEDESSADLVVGTVHQAKGQEWDSVLLADDFPNPLDAVARMTMKSGYDGDKKRAREELRIAYVAVTRARTRLDLGNGLWQAPRKITSNDNRQPKK